MYFGNEVLLLYSLYPKIKSTIIQRENEFELNIKKMAVSNALEQCGAGFP